MRTLLVGAAIFGALSLWGAELGAPAVSGPFAVLTLDAHLDSRPDRAPLDELIEDLADEDSEDPLVQDRPSTCTPAVSTGAVALQLTPSSPGWIGEAARSRAPPTALAA